MKALQAVISTNNSGAALLARLTLGVVLFPHGAQKVLGWFGGYGFSGTMGFFTGTLHIPALFGFLAIMTEFLGSIALILGVLSRVAALAVAVEMLVAIAMVHHTYGFFVNWSGMQKGEGYEYHLLMIGLALIVLIYGAGKASIDRALTTPATA